MPKHVKEQCEECLKIGASKSLNKSILEVILIGSNLEWLIIEKQGFIAGPLRERFRDTVRQFASKIPRNDTLAKETNDEIIQAFIKLEKDFSRFSKLISQPLNDVNIYDIAELFERCGGLLNEINYRKKIPLADRKTQKESMKKASSEFLKMCQKHKSHMFE